MRGLHDSLVVSNLSAAEFSSVIARRVGTRDLRTEEARAAFSNFDIWCARHTRPIEISNGDISAAIHLLRRLDLALRTPDALHLTITQRAGCALLSFDKLLASVARAIGVEV